MSLARILGKSVGRQSYISDSRWVLPTSFIGLEHEYEGVKTSTLPKHSFAEFWAYHEEGSLKDNGAEYVFATPLFGVDAWNALEWLVSHAKASGWKCTKRTGIHVHLDVRDLTVPQLAGLSIVYAAVEPLLYRWVGNGRDSSHFCIPLYRADEALLGACSIIRSAFQDDKQDGHSALVVAEEYQRYAGFNLQALHKFGSIEFRQLQTTHDLQRIEDWINMVMSFKATALKLPQSDGAVVKMIQRMGVQELLYYVFPDRLAKQLLTDKSEEEFLVRGLPSARDIAVHGCGDTSWVKRDFPKGENAGFIKWMKTKEVPKKVDEYYGGDLEDFEERAAPEQVQLQEGDRLHIQERDRPLFAADVNWGLLNEAPAGIAPAPPPAPEPRFGRMDAELDQLLLRNQRQVEVAAGLIRPRPGDQVNVRRPRRVHIPR